MKAPIYLYYGLQNFYQNHRRYVASRSDAQLRGEVVDTYSSLSACDPRLSEGDSTDPSKFFLPCGLIAWSLFNGKTEDRRQKTEDRRQKTEDRRQKKTEEDRRRQKTEERN
jgi:hypothetical protein